MSFYSRIPLYWKIIAALILGTVFGAIFHVNQGLLILKYYNEKGKVVKTEITNWESINVKIYDKNNKGQFSEYTFGSKDQIQIVKKFSDLKEFQRNNSIVEIKYKDNTKEYSNIKSIKKKSTIATQIRPIGTLFIRLLSFLAIPLVIASLIVGASSLDDIKKLGRVGLKTITIYVITTAIAITIGLAAANYLQPGKKVNEEAKNRLMGEYQDDSAEAITEQLDVDVIDFLITIVPKNPFNAMSSSNMIQIVFFAVVFGITLSLIDRKKAQPVMNFFSGVSETMIKMVEYIMKLAPYGVFALMAATIADFGFSIIMTLIWYIIAVVSGLMIHTFLTYSLLVKFMGKMSPLKFFKGIRNAQSIGFSTSSSAATLPVTFNNVEKNLGVQKQISGFVLPLGATINMDGTALYQGVAAVFIAQVYGFDLNIVEQLTVVLTAVLASIGTAPVPGVGIIMLVIILRSVHVPPEGIALILGVDRILDMMRTVTNVSGDSAVAVAIAGSEKAFDTNKH